MHSETNHHNREAMKTKEPTARIQCTILTSGQTGYKVEKRNGSTWITHKEFRSQTQAVEAAREIERRAAAEQPPTLF